MTREDYFEKGMELFSEDRLPEAIDELKKALEVDPAYGDALHAVAMSYYHLEKIDEAIEYGEQFRELEPENGHAYTSLSMFYNAKGFIAKAEEMAAKAAHYAARD